MFGRVSHLVVACVLLFAAAVFSSAAYGQAATPDYGVAAKRPVIGGACPNCPWGALADKVKTAMKPLGYDVQVCYVCSQENASRIVSERRVPPPPSPAQQDGRPPSPNAPVDFGAVSFDQMYQAYNGIGPYKAEGGRKNLRLIARIESPSYYLVATRMTSMITDLDQIKARRLPVRIYADRRAAPILEHYGITREALESWGGVMLRHTTENRASADVVIHFASSLNNTPESNVWYEITQKDDFRFLELSDAAIAKFLDAEPSWELGYVPVRVFRGQENRLKVPVMSGHVIYGRDDLPDQFTYDVAKAMDMAKQDLIFSVIPFSYNPDVVWQGKNVPVHPGAARYYREKAYMR